MKPSLKRRHSFDKISANDVPRLSAQTKKYNDVLRKSAAAYGAVAVDFFNTTIFENAATLSEDGNHPNGAGYDAIAKIWYQAITQ